DFDEHSHTYGRVLRTVPLPPPGNVGNEPHHCHLSADKNILACGGLLSVLSGQNGIFFFDVSHARHPVFLFSTSAANSSITDDFLPLPTGGFLVTQMGSASGGARAVWPSSIGISSWSQSTQAIHRATGSTHMGFPRALPVICSSRVTS